MHIAVIMYNMIDHERSDSGSLDNPWLKEGLFDDLEQSSEKDLPELPTDSHDFVCRFYLREIKRSGRLPDLRKYLSEALADQPKTYSSVEDYMVDNPNYDQEVDTSLSQREKDSILQYSGYRYAWINSVERGFWDYEKLGRKTPEAEKEIRSTANAIDMAIMKSPAPKQSFTTFRGTNLDGFRDYGIESLSDLVKMKGQFMLERGFASTSMLSERSFVGNEYSDNPLRSKTDIEIRYLIPSQSHDTVALTDASLSYSPEQAEVLLNRNSLSYVSDVNQDKDGHYVVDAILVPRSVYDPNHME